MYLVNKNNQFEQYHYFYTCHLVFVAPMRRNWSSWFLLLLRYLLLISMKLGFNLHSSSQVGAFIFYSTIISFSITAADKKSLLTNCVISMPNRFFKIIFYRQVLKSGLCLRNHQVVLRLQLNWKTHLYNLCVKISQVLSLNEKINFTPRVIIQQFFDIQYCRLR